MAAHTEMSTTTRDPPADFPAIPNTLNGAVYRDTAPPSTIPYYTPYLGLRARFSQVWFNRWTILLALILCRVLLAISDINYDISRAKEEALTACTSVENIGSAMASMPHYMSTGVNALAADGVTKAVGALMDGLMLTVTGVEEILVFVVNMYTSTYLCLITMAVGGSLEAGIEMIEKVGAFMNQSIGSITDDMSSAVSGFESTLNGFLKDLDIGSIFGSSNSPPTIDLSSQINELKTIKIDPTTMDADLTKLNNSIPNFSQVQNLTNSVLEFPFEFAKKAMNDSIANYTFDHSIFPVAPKQALTFCSDNSSINDFFNDLVKVVLLTRKIFIIVLVILMVIVMIPMAYREIWRWKTMQQRSTLLQKHAFDPMDVISIASRPYTTTAGIKAASYFKDTKRQILIRWWFSYAFSLPAIFVLSLALAGLISAFCQFIVLKVIEKEVPGLAQEVGAFADVVVNALNNASEAWAVSANGVIESTNAKVNSDVFGWVNVTTGAVNNTLNTFVDEMTKELNATFGGTVLYQPIMEVINCLIGIKIAGIEKGLTWVSDNAKVTFPEFRTDVFSLGAAASIAGNSSATDSFLSSPGDVTADDITSAIVKVSNKLEAQILQESIISAAILAVFVLNMFIGLCYVIFQSCMRDKTRAEGGPVGYTGDNRAPVSPRNTAGDGLSRFPEFGGPVSSVHPQTSSDEMWAAGASGNEKYGTTGHRSVEAAYKPGHERTSSYGYLSDEKQ
jgi:hypothetical protein